MVDYAHDKKGKRFDVKWGNMVVRHFSYEKKADMAKTEQQAKDRCRGSWIDVIRNLRFPV